MIALITLFALVTGYLVTSGLSRTRVEIAIEQERQTLQAMKEAKSSLITYVASRALMNDDPANTQNDQPGALPCPAPILTAVEVLANDPRLGIAGTCTSAASTRVGWFPWKTIGASELRDGSGQILWYALSANFRKLSGSTVINSDTPGTLTVTGDTPASTVVAVIIAPGAALNNQDRTTSTIANYLESTNATNTDAFVTAKTTDTFNDRLIVITQADLMAVLEPAVAARIERDIKPYLENYRSEWGVYPFPAVFSSGTYSTGPGPNSLPTTPTPPTPLRPQTSYIGDINSTSGLLPLNPSASYSWSTASGAVTLTGGTAASVSLQSACSLTGSSLRCTYNIASRNSVASCVTAASCILNPVVRVSATTGTNAGRSFADLPTASTVTVTNQSTTHPSGSCTPTTTKAISGTLTSSGLGTVNFDGTHAIYMYNASSFTCRMRVTIPVVTAGFLTGSGDPTAGWFIKNEWYRQIYYAVSPGFLPGGNGSCVDGTSCLTVDNLPLPNYNKKAILLFTGRAITGSHPSSNLTYYLEGVNQIPSNKIFTHRFGLASSVNDRAIVLSTSP